MRNAYLGVTLHYVNDYKLQKAFLGLVSLQGFSHTADLVLAKVEQLLHDYGLDLSNVFKVVTDRSLRSLIFCNCLMNSMILRKTRVMKMSVMHLCISQRLQTKAFCCPRFRRGSHHSLQLVLMDMFKESIFGTEDFKSMCKIMKKFKHSQQAKEELSTVSNKSLLFPSFTRWGSVVGVIQSYLKLKEFMRPIAERKSWAFPTEDQIEYLSQVAKLCSSFPESLRRIQGENFVTISRCLIYTRALQLSLDESKRTFPVYFDEIISKMKRNLDERISNILNLNRVNFDPTFLVACAVDPRTLLCLRESDLEKAAEWIRQLLPSDQDQQVSRKMPVTSPSSNATLDKFICQLNSEAHGNRRRTEGRSSQTKSRILNVLHIVQAAGSSAGEALDPIIYLCNYLSSDWHSMAILALEILTVPATSAPIERIFSHAGLASNGNRNRTNFNLLNAQLVVYCNDSVC